MTSLIRFRRAADGKSIAPTAHKAYITQNGRDLRLDLIRGLCVVIMIVDHVGGKSPLHLFTGGNRFLTSAAEGFILTSGLTAGLVYRRLVDRYGLDASIRKALRRAGSLYLLAAGIALFMAPLSELYGLSWAQGLDLTRPVEFVVSVLTLHRTYYLADVMVLYALLLAFMPLALWLLARGRGAVVVTASACLWLLHQVYPDVATITWTIEGNYLLLFSSWQLLFFVPLALAYRHDRLPRVSSAGQTRLLLLLGASFVVLLVIGAMISVPASSIPVSLGGLAGSEAARLWVEEWIFGKAELRIGRVVAAGLTFSFVFLGLTRGWRPLRRPLQSLLLPLGQNALYAFTAHTLLSLATPIVLPLVGASMENPTLNAALQAGAVAVIWAGSRVKLLAPTPRTRVVWYVSPLVLALVVLVALPRLPFAPPLSKPLPVNEAALARARAYGTPVASLEGAMFARSAAATLGPSLSVGTPTATTPPRTATPAPRAPAATPPGEATLSVTVTPLQGGLPAKSTPPPTATPTMTPTAPLELTPGLPDSFPALPPDESRVQSEYVAALSGRAYALSFFSELLQREVPYWVYLPPGYGDSPRRYPVLYALHGGGGSIEEWAAYGLLDSADLAFREGALRPYIIVLPQGDKSFWTNWANDSVRWGDYLAYEVVWQVDSSFATLRAPAARAVGGNSMGGWGALYQGLTHPDIFGVIVANSPSLYADDGSLRFLGEGDEYASKDPLSLGRSAENVAGLRVWLDVGEEDPWLARTQALQDILQERQIQHEWRLYPGIHGPEYWAQHVPDYLAFCGRTLRWE
jgi:enterochelin esterase-like enzyme